MAEYKICFSVAVPLRLRLRSHRSLAQSPQRKYTVLRLLLLRTYKAALGKIQS